MISSRVNMLLQYVIYFISTFNLEQMSKNFEQKLLIEKIFRMEFQVVLFTELCRYLLLSQ